jgi:hypothetical protein
VCHIQCLWALYQTKVKKAMHAATPRTVAPRLATQATQGQLAAQAAHLAANPGSELTAVESFTGPVPKTLKGSKRYWRAAFIQLMAMCIEVRP